MERTDYAEVKVVAVSGGSFSTAGFKPSAYVAQAELILQGGVVQDISVEVGGAAIDCLGLPRTGYAVQRATDALFTKELTTLLTTNGPAPDGLFRCIDSSSPGATIFYRLHRQ